MNSVVKVNRLLSQNVVRGVLGESIQIIIIFIFNVKEIELSPFGVSVHLLIHAIVLTFNPII